MWLGVFDTALRSGQEQADVPFIEAWQKSVRTSHTSKRSTTQSCATTGGALPGRVPAGRA